MVKKIILFVDLLVICVYINNWGYCISGVFRLFIQVVYLFVCVNDMNLKLINF